MSNDDAARIFDDAPDRRLPPSLTEDCEPRNDPRFGDELRLLKNRERNLAIFFRKNLLEFSSFCCLEHLKKVMESASNTNERKNCDDVCKHNQRKKNEEETMKTKE